MSSVLRCACQCHRLDELSSCNEKRQLQRKPPPPAATLKTTSKIKRILFSFFLDEKECKRMRYSAERKRWSQFRDNSKRWFTILCTQRNMHGMKWSVRARAAHAGKFTVTKLFATFHSSCDFLAVGWNVGLPLKSNIFLMCARERHEVHKHTGDSLRGWKRLWGRDRENGDTFATVSGQQCMKFGNLFEKFSSSVGVCFVKISPYTVAEGAPVPTGFEQAKTETSRRCTKMKIHIFGIQIWIFLWGGPIIHRFYSYWTVITSMERISNSRCAIRFNEFFISMRCMW